MIAGYVDAAYGGYFTLADNLKPNTRRNFDCIPAADSIVVDPHKHGLQPYGCGCILFKDPATGAFYKHDSPYTYFTSADLHLGEISLECSRAGAAAVALWATQRFLPLTADGDFARDMALCRDAACDLHARLSLDDRFLTIINPNSTSCSGRPTRRKRRQSLPYRRNCSTMRPEKTFILRSSSCRKVYSLQTGPRSNSTRQLPLAYAPAL